MIMKFMISKNKYSGGGLYLRCIALIFAAVTRHSDVDAKYLHINEAINRFNQMNWRVIGNNKIVEAKKDSWIKQQKYSDSIIKVIGEAIGNCVTGMGEFATK